MGVSAEAGCSIQVVKAVANSQSQKVGFIGLARDWEEIDVALNQ